LGARLLGISAHPPGANLNDFAAGIRDGLIKTLIVFREDVTRFGLGADLLGRLETVIASSILPNETTERAHYVLPGCAPAEKRGSFTNAQGRVQRFMKAVEPPGEARPESEFLRELLEQVTGRPLPANPEGLFNLVAAEIPAFAGVTWAALGDAGVTVPI
jgi:predicted molibdopterin-dependent oxidoreductase YjgC